MKKIIGSVEIGEARTGLFLLSYEILRQHQTAIAEFLIYKRWVGLLVLTFRLNIIEGGDGLGK